MFIPLVILIVLEVILNCVQRFKTFMSQALYNFFVLFFFFEEHFPVRINNTDGNYMTMLTMIFQTEEGQ